jgi:rhodanese-related sulfurtransferase
MIKKYYCLLISFCIIACNNAQTKMNLTADEFEKSIAQDSIQLLDVRTVGEFTSGHIKNALWADWNNSKEFERRTSFITQKKPVYVYCLSGGRSATAATYLRNKGYTVFELKGGINAWKAANKNIEGKTTGKQMTIDEYNTGIAKTKTVLVDFGASWCPPCKTMEPIINAVLQKKDNNLSLFKIDGGKDDEILKKYNVTALPVFIIYKNGKEVWRKDGVASEKEILDALQ